MTGPANDHLSSADALVRQLEAEPQPDRYAIMYGYLVRVIDGCNCAGGTPESSYLHESHCGFEPVIAVDRLDAVVGLMEAARAFIADARGVRSDLPTWVTLRHYVAALDAS